MEFQFNAEELEKADSLSARRRCQAFAAESQQLAQAATAELKRCISTLQSNG